MLDRDGSGTGKWPLRSLSLKQSVTNYLYPGLNRVGLGVTCHPDTGQTETLTVTLLSHLLESKGNLQGLSWLGCSMPWGSVHILRQACQTSCSNNRLFELLLPEQGASHRCHLPGWHSHLMLHQVTLTNSRLQIMGLRCPGHMQASVLWYLCM